MEIPQHVKVFDMEGRELNPTEIEQLKGRGCRRKGTNKVSPVTMRLPILHFHSGACKGGHSFWDCCPKVIYS